MTATYSVITAILLEIKRQANVAELFPALYPEASELLHHNPYAFISSACLDRGTKTEIIWTIPYWLQQMTGHFDALQYHSLTLAEITHYFQQLPQKPRYLHDAPRTFQEITRIIVEEFDGDTTRIWLNHQAVDVRRTLMRVHGVGPGIANMAVLLIERAYGIHFPDHDRMDIKPDVHTMRVLYRLGLAAAVQEDEAVRAARALNASFPGDIDEPLWLVGRKWCTARNPQCLSCPLDKICIKVMV